MLRHTCGFRLANDGHDTRVSTALPRAQEYPAHGYSFATCKLGARQKMALLYLWKFRKMVTPLGGGPGPLGRGICALCGMLEGVRVWGHVPIGTAPIITHIKCYSTPSCLSAKSCCELSKLTSCE